MKYVRVGSSGLKVSAFALGGAWFGDPKWKNWALPEADCQPILQRAFDLGVNMIDTADQYSNGGSEEIIGNLWPQMLPRDAIILATKAFHPTGPSVNERGLSRKHLMSAVDGSLRRLKTDYIDLYQIHRTDESTPIEETLDAMNDIVRAGKARYLGVSNAMAWQFMKILAICEKHGWARPIAVQNHYNLAYREEEREMLSLCRSEGIGHFSWSPLGRGFLAATMARDGQKATVRAASDTTAAAYFNEPHDLDVLDRVVACAARHGRKPAQIALAWMIQRANGSIPVLGASKLMHVEDAVGALDIQLSAEDIASLEAPYKPHRVLLHL